MDPVCLGRTDQTVDADADAAAAFEVEKNGFHYQCCWDYSKEVIQLLITDYFFKKKSNHCFVSSNQ